MKTPLSLRERPADFPSRSERSYDIVDRTGASVVSGQFNRDAAQRIVASVNALADVPLPALEQAASK